jgi:hypothetical protein
MVHLSTPKIAKMVYSLFNDYEDAKVYTISFSSQVWIHVGQSNW